jgi:hypothetical protein
MIFVQKQCLLSHRQTVARAAFDFVQLQQDSMGVCRELQK